MAGQGGSGGPSWSPTKYRGGHQDQPAPLLRANLRRPGGFSVYGGGGRPAKTIPSPSPSPPSLGTTAGRGDTTCSVGDRVTERGRPYPCAPVVAGRKLPFEGNGTFWTLSYPKIEGDVGRTLTSISSPLGEGRRQPPRNVTKALSPSPRAFRVLSASALAR